MSVIVTLTAYAVFQIRIGGVKGLLVAYPDDLFEALCVKHKSGCTCYKLKLGFRGSMLKYEGGPRDIEVNRISHDPTPARINHGFIILLLTLDRKLIKARILSIKCE
jgi:RNA-dependent RNA polymerase